ncbi:MAG: hypothetical protein NTX33_15955 [Propionibacteriales bacterium]|nr:hypothetical protein [Propionibacteriales bacterium]
MRWWAAALGCVLAIGLVLVTPAEGRVRTDARAAVVPATGAVARVLDATGVEDYWTEDRMDSAVPLGLDENGEVITSPQPAAPRSSPRAAALTAPRSVGRLFFTNARKDYACSAAAVNTAEKNVIITAAHCVHGKPDPCPLLQPCVAAYFTNFLFVPRFANGSAPDGRWVGTRAITHQQWIANEDTEFDQALIEVAPRNGRNLVRVVGGNGLAWNYPVRQEDIRVWGWPAQAPYDGETVRRCTGNTSAFDGSGDAKIACPMTGGASGGPWFISMVNSDVGHIWAVTSRRTLDGPANVIAHPLGNSIRTLLDNARANRAVARTTTRALSRARITLRAVPQHVGRGQLLRLRSRTSANTRVVLEVRFTSGGVWHRVTVRRTGSDGIVEIKQRPARVGLRWYRVRTATALETVRVRVHPCPLPAERTAAVLDATACTQPAG